MIAVADALATTNWHQGTIEVSKSAPVGPGHLLVKARPDIQVAPLPDGPSAARATFEREVSGRFGVMPNFFCSASAAPGLIEELWAFAKSAYIDNPLPSLFKERLFVHLSRFCEVRYCIIPFGQKTHLTALSRGLLMIITQEPAQSLAALDAPLTIEVPVPRK